MAAIGADALRSARDEGAALFSERLCLRPIRAEDAATLHRLLNDWDVARHLGSVPFPYPRADLEAWIARTRAEREAGRAWHLAIATREDDRLIGAAGLTREDRRTARLGYWIGRPFWRRGYAREAASRLVRHAFDDLGFDQLTAYVADDNDASVRVLAHLGFRFTHEAEHDFLSRGGAFPVRWFRLTRGEALRAAGFGAGAPGVARPIVLVAAVALIDADGRVLLARRPEGKALAGLWEFPGGKLRDGETPEAALIRELREELGIDVAASCLAPFAFASHAYETFHLLMPLYLCRRWRGVVTPLEGQELAWVRPWKLADYPMPPADVPLVAMLRDFL
ncbi:MAG: bifunctional GNAT family N-acetyltransferase/(deoxy)nucleoside triphosphate pyrophosphohydrolase [Acetobacteraceae bacterium]|nr:bifunctional GNAT family N-acetyltransferase/(deoxy)nucleoside triphosphate pyrophosphohydrolase [Acetobacteraceae bacterium]